MEAKGDSTAYWKTEAAADFSGISNRKLDCSGFLFPADAKFRSSRVEGGSSFAGATFLGLADFSSATFQEGAKFHECKFHGDSDFEAARFFHFPADFTQVEVAGSANFERTRFESHADFQQAKFGGAAGFNHAEFLQGALFDNARFQDDAAFISAKFSANASWFNARFLRAAYFSDAIFSGPARFAAVEFVHTAAFTEAQFSNSAYFRKAKFHATADFSGATFQATFQQLANFENVEFFENVNFERAEFRGLAKFRGARFHRGVSFSAIAAESSFDMADARFDSNVPDFIQAHFREAPRLDYIHVPSVPDLRRASVRVGSYATARYRALKRLALQGHDHERELQFFADELRSQQGGRWGLFVRLYGHFSDFGRSIARPLTWWFGTTALFAGIYAGMHNVGDDASALCKGANADLLAIYLSLRRALVFPGFGPSQELERIYGCLFGTATLSADGGERVIPFIPDLAAYSGIVQTLFSAVLIFLFLLAVRNHFRIK